MSIPSKAETQRGSGRERKDRQRAEVAPAQPLLSIPNGPESLNDFKVRVGSALVSKNTHIYLDTSFLMWMTTLGRKSRGELLAWMRSDCLGRIHVPVWSAHEYLKHYAAKTLVINLKKRTERVANVIRRTYGDFRTFLDEESLDQPAEDHSKLRASARDAIAVLQRLVQECQRWPATHDQHAAEVITLINEIGTNSTHPYDQFPTLATVGASRYAGYVPPGFKDDHKGAGGDANDSADKDAGPRESNRYGDLLFWKEVLDHAKTAKASCIAIISNDVKSDWRMGGGQERSEIGLPAKFPSWGPLPRAHPMLVLEARIAANVESVVLLDSCYLALLLGEDVSGRFARLIDVAIVPGPTTGAVSDGLARKQQGRSAIVLRREQAAAAATAAASQGGIRFPDDVAVQDAPGTLASALLKSKPEIADESEKALLAAMRAEPGGEFSVMAVLTSDALRGRDHCSLVRIARELHDRVLANNVSGYETSLADLIACLHEFPIRTATCFYLGFLASMYLRRADNMPLLPPRSTVADLLFARQTTIYASKAIGALVKRIAASGKPRPLYVPNVEAPRLSMEFDIESDTDSIDQLSSLRVSDVELLTLGQADPNLSLENLFSGFDAIDVELLKRKACELYGLPFEQVDTPSHTSNSFTLAPTIGFKQVDLVQSTTEA